VDNGAIQACFTQRAEFKVNFYRLKTQKLDLKTETSNNESYGAKSDQTSQKLATAHHKIKLLQSPAIRHCTTND